MNGNKTYEINIDVDLYRKITNSLNNIMGDLNGTLSKSKINPFSGELLTYYNSLENNVSSKLESIIGEIEELGLKIDTSINTYQNIDEELRFGLDSIVDKIFEVGNGSGISIEFDGLSTYQERKEYLEKLIESYTTTLEELKKEYNNLYGNGIVIEYHEQFQNWFTIVTSLGGVNNFNSGLGNIYNQNGNLDIDNLSIILNFYKENNLNVKLKNYIIDGKSWSDSGLSSFNDNELTDNENEFNFLYSIYDSFGISSNEYVENIFFDGYDSYNEENINTAKSFLSQKMDFNLFGKLNETYTDCITKQADIINLQSAIYNYEQYQKLMPFEEARRNIDYLDYISKDYSNYDNDILNGNMYGGKYKDYLNYMDQSEVALYDYIYTKQGSDIAETYLFALTDTINQRKGFEKASNYVSNLNQNGLDAGDFFASGWEGFKDGNINFFNGISNFFTADGIVSDFDYEMLYKMQLLSSDEYKNYTNNLSDEAKKFLSYNYQINNSIGNMTIPMLVSFVPVVGKSASSALMWTSSTGNATEQAMQGGASKSTAYLYGGLSGLSEVAFEKIMGGIPGLSDGVGVGFKGIFKDMVSEGNEEYLQTWIDAGLRSTILGEEIDLTNVTGESFESAIMGMFVSGQMKVGMSLPVKFGNKIVNISTKGQFSDFESFKAHVEIQFENNGIDLTSAVNNSKDFHNMPNLQNVTNVTFDPNSNMYRAQFSDGKIRSADDVGKLSNSTLKSSNTSLTNVVTDEEVINKSSINETVVNHNAPSTSPNNFFNFTFNFNGVQEKIKNTTGAILTKVGDVGNLLKGFVLNTAMAEEDIDVIDDINTEETIIKTNSVISNGKINDFVGEKSNDLTSIRLKNSDVISNYSFSKTVTDFIKRIDSDVSKLMQSSDAIMKSTQSINSIINNYGMFDPVHEEKNISIADIISSGQEKYKDEHILNTFDDYFNTHNKNADSYHTRANSLLKYLNGESLINGIKEFGNTLDMKICEYQDGSYIIGSNGLHRYTVLRFFYLLDLTNGVDVEALREKYTLPMTVEEKINYDNTFIKYFCHQLFPDLNNFMLDDESKSDNKIHYNMYFKQQDNTKVVKIEKSELLTQISDLLQNNENKYLLPIFKNDYFKDNNFRKFIDNNFSNLRKYILSFNEVPAYIDIIENDAVKPSDLEINNSLLNENNHIDIPLDDMIFNYNFSQLEQTTGDDEISIINQSEIEKYLQKIKQDPSDFHYIPVEIKIKYPEICLEAIKQDSSNFYYIPDEIRMKHPEICIEAIKQDSSHFYGISDEIKMKHPEICIEAIKQDSSHFYGISDEIKMKHPEICIEAIKQDSSNFYDISDEIKEKYPEICLEAVKQNVRLILSIPNEILIQHPKIYLEAAKQDGDVLDIAPTDIMIQYPEICLEAIKQNADKIKNVPDQLLTEEMYIQMISVNRFVVDYVPEYFKIKYPELCLEAEKKCIIDIKEKCERKVNNSKTAKEREYLTKFYSEYLPKFVNNSLISKQQIYEGCDKFNFLTEDEFDVECGEYADEVLALNRGGIIYIPFNEGKRTRPINDYFKTLCHEFTHTCGALWYVLSEKSNVEGLNEGLTEIFAQEILNYDTSYISYDDSVKGIQDIISIGIPGLSKMDFNIAYFQKHNLTDIRKTIDNLMGEDYFDSTLLPAFNTVSVHSDDQDTTKIKKVTDEIKLRYLSLTNELQY